MGALPCSSDSFSFSSETNAMSYHEQEDSLALIRAERLSGIPCPDAKSVEINRAGDGFACDKGSLNDQGQQHKLPIRCDNGGISWKLGSHGDGG